MDKIISHSQHCCALCRNWNGGRGSDTLRPNGPKFVCVDNTEEHPCMVNSFNRQALYGLGCHDFANKF